MKLMKYSLCAVLLLNSMLVLAEPKANLKSKKANTAKKKVTSTKRLALEVAGVVAGIGAVLGLGYGLSRLYNAYQTGTENKDVTPKNDAKIEQQGDTSSSSKVTDTNKKEENKVESSTTPKDNATTPGNDVKVEQKENTPSSQPATGDINKKEENNGDVKTSENDVKSEPKANNENTTK